MGTTKGAEVSSVKVLSVDEELREQIAKDYSKLQTKVMKHTGIAFTLIYRPHMGFADYAIVKLRLKDGRIEEVEWISEPLCAQEAMDKMELHQGRHLETMRRNYPPEFQHV